MPDDILDAVESSTEDVKTESTNSEKEEPEEVVEDETPKDVSPHERISFKDIKEKAPELLKQVPELRNIFFRERAYAEVFPTVGAAREAAERAETFTQIESDIMSGSGEFLLQNIKESGGLDKFAGNIIDTLHKIDPDAAWRAVLPTLQNISRAFLLEGKKRGDKNWENSALYLSEYLFGDADVVEGKREAVKSESSSKKEVDTERAKMQAERYSQFSTDVADDAGSGLRAEISKALESETDLAPFVRKSMTDEIFKSVNSQLNADKVHMRNMDSLWKQASKSLTSANKTSIINAYLARAKQIIPSVKSKMLSEARGASGNKQQNQQNNNSGQPAKPFKVTSAKQVDWSKTSDHDFLSGKITYKN